MIFKWLLGKRKKARFSTPSKKTVKRIARKVVHGEHYNLQEIYDQVNALYFEGRVDVQITWFGSQKRAARRRRTLGLYDFNSKLIKIHRLLDQPHFPSYFISYVVYHEMLHHLFPPYPPKRGRRKIHHADFKRHEKKFAEYSLAKEWEKENHQIFFSKKGGRR
ncbi:MAG: SprT-like domain-containing protein [Parachlamydiales bacterium]